jgi:hypothetical protein
MAHTAHKHLHDAAEIPSTSVALAAWPAQVFWWLVMVVAMMFPLLIDHVRNTAARSLWSRRHRAIGTFLAGYAGPWLLFGMTASGVHATLKMQTWAYAPVIGASGFAIALLWQAMPSRRCFTLACHKTVPIAPTGWRADRDCLRYGWTVGVPCVISCGVLMLACLLMSHSILAMVGVSLIVLFERRRVRPRQLFACVAIAVLAAIMVVSS